MVKLTTDEPINLLGDDIDVSDDETRDEMEEVVSSATPISNQNMHESNLSGNPVKRKWGIDKKIVSITLYNASSNDYMDDTLKFDLNLMSYGDYYHVRCCSHMLNFIVQDDLKELDGAIIKVRLFFQEEKGNGDTFMKNMAKKMHLKFDKYLCEFSTSMGIVIAFYPHYKFHFIDWDFKKIYCSSSDIDLDL
uniref:hAT-like transposase RNase-H fold domain-containing protein n=1 Tax=Lactuca sativa TaxID=4236 RepID=A0A9R1XX51_LACSA|nr:hypothetical protein LSAT_V11C100012880 [Lactuca sativa]